MLFTDFGVAGPYIGQMAAVLRRHLFSEMPVVDLLADAPSCNPKAASYLLAACTGAFPPGSVFLCVVDPGVGGPRRPCIVRADDRWYIGPDNGLFEHIIRRSATTPSFWYIIWKPRHLSSSFHGRDLFAPLAALVARDQIPPRSEFAVEFSVTDRCVVDWPDDLAEVVYVDAFGNAITGVRAATVAAQSTLGIGGCAVAAATTFMDVSPGQAFWYANSNGLIEIAVNRGRAAEEFFLNIGSPVFISSSEGSDEGG